MHIGSLVSKKELTKCYIYPVPINGAMIVKTNLGTGITPNRQHVGAQMQRTPPPLRTRDDPQISAKSSFWKTQADYSEGVGALIVFIVTAYFIHLYPNANFHPAIYRPNPPQSESQYPLLNLDQTG